MISCTVLRNKKNQRALWTRDGETMGPGKWALRRLNIFSTAKHTIVEARGPRGSQLVVAVAGSTEAVCGVHSHNCFSRAEMGDLKRQTSLLKSCYLENLAPCLNLGGGVESWPISYSKQGPKTPESGPRRTVQPGDNAVNQ